MILKTLSNMSIFGELIKCLKDKKLNEKKIILIGNDTIEYKIFKILLRYYHFQCSYCKNYVFFSDWFKKRGKDEKYFYVVVDKDYKKWLKILNSFGEISNYAIPLIR